MQLLPDVIDGIWLLMAIDKTALNLSLLCQIVCSTQFFACLLIDQMRLYQPEKFWFAIRDMVLPGIKTPQVSDRDYVIAAWMMASL